jgi:hypothetical protein
MPAEISRSYEGPADSCPRCRTANHILIDVWCAFCHGTTWLSEPPENPLESVTVQRDLLRAACRDALDTLDSDDVREMTGVAQCIKRIQAALANVSEEP